MLISPGPTAFSTIRVKFASYAFNLELNNPVIVKYYLDIDICIYYYFICNGYLSRVKALNIGICRYTRIYREIERQSKHIIISGSLRVCRKEKLASLRLSKEMICLSRTMKGSIRGE